VSSGPGGNGPEARHYTRSIDVLCVCTANMCRSPMLEVLLGSALRARGVDAHVHSAGTLADGRGAVREVLEVSADRGHDLRPHQSRRLSPELVRGADLSLPLAREHLREIVVMAPEAFARTFTPKELVRRATDVGGRRPGEALPAFLDRVHEGRTPQQLMGNDSADDVADPIGGPRSAFERTAVELEQLALSIAVLLAPEGADALAPTSPLIHLQET
jgi:protein-tyrosine phosphatase